jgi:ribosomal protein S18 acetylase RimI-like enzyme
MLSFENHNIGFATITDVSAIKDLLNISYRGESSRQGWTTEANLIEGETRADEAMVMQVIQQTGSVFLVYKNDKKKIIGCVNLQEQNDRIYLGMFSVSPALQGGGIGKQLLLASEEYSRSLQKKSIFMSVISLRTELISWYMRHGYTDTGERKPFAEDGLTGKHLQPLEFMMLEKSI